MLGNLFLLNGIITYFLNKDFKLWVTFLAIPEQTSLYTSINIIEGIVTIIKDFSIKNKWIRYFILNNITNNNTVITAIIKEFNFNLIKN